MIQTIGIVGGLGTEASCSFCLNVNHKVRKTHAQQPHLIMDNVPVPHTVLEALAQGKLVQGKESSQEALVMLTLLQDSVKRLNALKVSSIVIPCNTVHVFLQQLRRISSAPIVSIIEETARECKSRLFKKVGLLASGTTVKAGLYEKELKKQDIELVIPLEEEQQKVSEIIIRAANSEHTEEDRKLMLSLVQNFEEKGAEAVVLGCTDLFLIVKAQDASLPLINSTEVLEDTAVRLFNLLEKDE